MDETAQSRPKASEPPRTVARTGAHRTDDPALRLRMKRQAQIMIVVAFTMLVLALSVPFVLHYLDIKLP